MTTPLAHRLSLREKLSYGCADFASVLFWHTFMVYLTFFYTDVYGLSAAAVGTMLLFSRILDGASDILVGIWADRTQTRWGKFRPFILFGCVPFAVFGVLTFTTPNFDDAGKLIWAYVTYNGLMTLYTIVNIPYTAMLGVATPDSAERTKLSSIKFIFAFSAGIVVSATLLPLAKLLGGDNAQLGWQLAFIVYGVVAVIFFLITFFGTRERVSAPVPDGTTLGRDLKQLFTNQPWLILVSVTLTFILFVALRSSVSTHYIKYFIYDGQPDRALTFLGQEFTFVGLTSAFQTLGQACSVAGVLILGLGSARMGKKAAFFTAYGIALATTAGYYFLSPGQVGAIFILQALGSFASAPLPVLLWAMYADTADYGEWKYNRRATGLVFSASTMSQKIGWAFGAFFALQLLDSVGFVANAEPSAEVKNGLVWLTSLLPVAFGIISVVLMIFYPLSEARMKSIATDLEKRRADAPGA
jgi:GPH family glycoside/pentoside/hexuronide:cation symporter